MCRRSFGFAVRKLAEISVRTEKVCRFGVVVLCDVRTGRPPPSLPTAMRTTIQMA